MQPVNRKPNIRLSLRRVVTGTDGDRLRGLSRKNVARGLVAKEKPARSLMDYGLASRRFQRSLRRTACPPSPNLGDSLADLVGAPSPTEPHGVDAKTHRFRDRPVHHFLDAFVSHGMLLP